MENRFVFGTYIFYPTQGEIVEVDNLAKKTHLGPQPSKLLGLLISEYPNVLVHEKIRQEIWPEVQVDYDQSVHFCIRQIRAALGDKASQPTYIKTVPRIGYQWLLPLNDTPSDRKAIPQSNKKRSRWPRWLIASLLAFISVMFILYTIRRDQVAQFADFRIGIMPFSPTEKTHPFFDNDIDLQLVDLLTNSSNKNYQVIGPTTTFPFKDMSLERVAEELKLDCILNARYGTPNNEAKMLAEVIRPSDGRHIWVRYFSDSTNYHIIADSIAAGVKKHF